MMLATGQVQTIKRGGAKLLRKCETQVPKKTKKDDFENKNEEKFQMMRQGSQNIEQSSRSRQA